MTAEVEDPSRVRPHAKRVQSTTARWARRLGVSLLASLALHSFPGVIIYRALRNRDITPIKLPMNEFEIGIESRKPPPRTTPPVERPSKPAPITNTPSVDPPRPPQPTRVTNTTAPQNTAGSGSNNARVLTALGNDSTLGPPQRDLVVPNLHVRPVAPSLFADAGLANSLLNVDAGVVATTPAPPTLIPMDQAAGSLSPAIPNGALITVLVLGKRIRSSLYAGPVERLLQGIFDWKEILQLNPDDPRSPFAISPIQDLDEAMFAVAKAGSDTAPTEWVAMVRARDNDEQRLIQGINRLVAADGQRAPSPLHPEANDASANANTSLDGGVSTTFGLSETVHSVTLNRYYTATTYAVFQGGLGAFGTPERIATLQAALARRGPSVQSRNDPRLAALAESDNARAVIASIGTRRGDIPLPAHATVGIYLVLDDLGEHTGALDLLARFQYDSPQQAQSAKDMASYLVMRGHQMIQEQAPSGPLSLGRFVASAAGADLDEIEGALDTLQAEVQGKELVLHARLLPQQIFAIINAKELIP